jgi:DNA invertase Pin-like site-specific DNA recombinase
LKRSDRRTERQPLPDPGVAQLVEAHDRAHRQEQGAVLAQQAIAQKRPHGVLRRVPLDELLGAGDHIEHQFPDGQRCRVDVEGVADDGAESARSDDRPVLQEMLRELPTLGASLLIVHKVDRLARNRLDDAKLYERLMGMGVTLVSASENIDATPAGRLMHGMLATFAEYYSNNLATEIKKGLHQKHKIGGTPFKPPIGYLPVRRWIEGKEIRTVEVDWEAGPLVRLAFDLYATGDWSLARLTKHLADQELCSRPTPKRLPRRSP